MTFKQVLARFSSASAVFCKPGTERVEALCAALGAPQNAFPVIHVTGTNGKGSTSRMIAEVLREAGYQTGQFSSPYLCSPTESVRIGGAPIDKRRFSAAAAAVFTAADTLTDPPTEFELLTVIALEAFRRAKVEIAVIEVGMGGRTDATNVISTPLLSVITGVSREHTAYLGDTVKEIAGEKAGIIKEGCPVLLGKMDKEARAVISARARSLHAPLYESDFTKFSLLRATPAGSTFTYRAYKDIPLSRLGLYQTKNAALALDALSLLRPRLPRVEEDSIRRALAALHWEGRFECLSSDPPVYFDGGHNPEGVAAAEESIRTYFKEGVILVSGILKDKDSRAVTRILAPHARAVFTVTPPSNRALRAEEYAHAFAEAGIPAQPCESVEQAFALALAEAKKRALPLLCIGSLYLYSDVGKALKRLAVRSR